MMTGEQLAWGRHLWSKLPNMRQAPEAFYNKRVTSQSESNTTATYLLRCKKNFSK